MSAQVVALQSTVHTPLATLLTPATRAATPTLSVPATLPTRLIPSLASLVALPSLPIKPSLSHRPTPSHSPDPIASLITAVLPTATPSQANPVVAQPTPSTTAASPVTASPSPSPSATGSPSSSPSPTGSTGPLPFATGGGNFFPH